MIRCTVTKINATIDDPHPSWHAFFFTISMSISAVACLLTPRTCNEGTFWASSTLNMVFLASFKFWMWVMTCCQARKLCIVVCSVAAMAEDVVCEPEVVGWVRVGLQEGLLGYWNSLHRICPSFLRPSANFILCYFTIFGNTCQWIHFFSCNILFSNVLVCPSKQTWAKIVKSAKRKRKYFLINKKNGIK